MPCVLRVPHLQLLKRVAGRNELVSVALNTHGTRAVQKLIETLSSREQRQIAIEALKPGASAHGCAKRCTRTGLPGSCSCSTAASLHRPTLIWVRRGVDTDCSIGMMVVDCEFTKGWTALHALMSRALAVGRRPVQRRYVESLPSRLLSGCGLARPCIRTTPTTGICLPHRFTCHLTTCYAPHPLRPHPQALSR